MYRIGFLNCVMYKMLLQPLRGGFREEFQEQIKGPCEFVVMFRAPGGILGVKRSRGTSPCLVKDSSCCIMQGGFFFVETINGHHGGLLFGAVYYMETL